jgi:nucleoside-diphosphate-sugar epimerase
VRTIVVTGASGFVGRRVVGLLAGEASGARVIGIDLVPPALDVDAETRSAAAVYHLLDLARSPRERLLAAFDGADTVLHLAWSHAEPGGPISPDDRAGASPNLDSLRRVLEVADQAGVRTLVHLSSSTVYGAWPDNPVPLPEDAALRPNPGFGFAVEKAEAERVIAEWADEHPTVAVAVLRPAVTVGMAPVVGSAGPALNQALGGTRGPRQDDGGRPMQFLHVDDLAGAVMAAREKGLRGVYNVAPDGWITEDDARALAGGVARVTLPGRLVRLLATVRWDLLRTGTPKEALAYSIHPWVVANDRLRAVGWVPGYSNEEALVHSDGRSHWDDLPPSRRQKLMLLAAAVAVVATAGAVAAGVAGLLARAGRARRQGATTTG